MKRIVAGCLLGLALTGAGRADRLVLVAGGDAAGAPAMREPYALDFDADGRLYIACMAQGQRIYRMPPGGAPAVFAGTGEQGAGGDGGPAAAARFNGIHSIAVTPAGDVLVADTWNCRVRRIDAATGIISAFAGTGEKDFGGDGGPAAQARFGGVYSVALDPQGETLYMADLDHRRVRAMNLRTGIIRTFAGDGRKGVPEDGTAAISTERHQAALKLMALNTSSVTDTIRRSRTCFPGVDTPR